MIMISKKGCDFFGDNLTEENLKSETLVVWKKGLYYTGNRRNDLVELANIEGEFVRTVKMKNIKLAKSNH